MRWISAILQALKPWAIRGWARCTHLLAQRRIQRRLIVFLACLCTVTVLGLVLSLTLRGVATGFAILFFVGCISHLASRPLLPRDPMARAIVKCYGMTAMASVFSVAGLFLLGILGTWTVSYFDCGSTPCLQVDYLRLQNSRPTDHLLFLSVMTPYFCAAALLANLGFGVGDSKLPRFPRGSIVNALRGALRMLTYWALGLGTLDLPFRLAALAYDHDVESLWFQDPLVVSGVVASLVSAACSAANWLLVLPLRWAFTMRLLWRLA